MAKKASKKPRAQAKPMPQRKVTLKTPKSLTEASLLVEEMRAHATMREKLKFVYDREITDLENLVAAKKEERKNALAPVDAKITETAETVYDYVEANRDELTRRGDVKNVKFLLDDVGKWSAASYVEYDEDKPKKLIDEIIKLGRFDLLKIEPDKKAITAYLKTGKLTHARMSTRNRFRYELTGVTDRITANLSGEKRNWFFVTPQEQPQEPAKQA